MSAAAVGTMPTLDYTSAGPVLSRFLRSDSFVQAIRGPVGSGKSVGCAIKILRVGCQQAPDKDKVRKTRWAVVRNTYAELKTTTIKTWREWFNDDWGKFTWSAPYTHMIRVALPDKTTLEIEVIFLALDRPEHVKKLLSMELTGVWINEAREITKPIVDACTMRVGRYPSQRDTGPTWFGVIMDTNSPDEQHWWAIMSGECLAPEYMTAEEKLLLVKPDDWEFFTQPPAMFETLNDEGDLKGYELNEARENATGCTADYYTKIMTGKDRRWIKVYILNKYQTLTDGKAVFPTFRRETTVAKSPINPVPEIDVIVGIDFGRTPSAIFCQQFPNLRWTVFHELLATDMGAARFAGVIRREILSLGIDGEDWNVRFYGDPAGEAKSQTDENTPFMILRANGVPAIRAPSNDVSVRLEAVEGVLGRMCDGLPGLLISPTCPNLIAGFEGGYQYRRIQSSGEAKYDDKPDKNRFSHPHDGLQYALLGGGEAKHVLSNTKTRNRPSKPAVMGWDPFKRSVKARIHTSSAEKRGFRGGL